MTDGVLGLMLAGLTGNAGRRIILCEVPVIWYASCVRRSDLRGSWLSSLLRLCFPLDPPFMWRWWWWWWWWWWSLSLGHRLRKQKMYFTLVTVTITYYSGFQNLLSCDPRSTIEYLSCVTNKYDIYCTKLMGEVYSKPKMSILYCLFYSHLYENVMKIIDLII